MNSSLDIVTLSWCLGEIRQSFAQAETLLEKQLAAEPDDLAALRSARAHVHQAHGALMVIDVPGVSTLTREIEQSLDAIESASIKLSGELVSHLNAAMRASVECLEDLTQGQPHQPMYLFPYLRVLLEARGAERVHPADLFSVDLARSLPAVSRDESLIGAEQIEKARQGFETGLLRYLREPGSPRGVEYMFSAITTLERSSAAGSNRNFWRVVLAFFDALRTGALPPDVYSRKLLARINMQMRQTIEKGAPIADRLFRDTLFSLAYAKGGSPIVIHVRRIYELDGVVPEDFETPRYGKHDVRAVRSARDALARAKVSWDKVMRGAQSEMTQVSIALEAFRDSVDQLPGAGMKAMAAGLLEVRRSLASRQDGLIEPNAGPITLELATAILFAEQVLEQGGRAGEQYDPQAADMAARLSNAAQGRVDQLGEVPHWLRAFARAAQERLTMTTFVAETLGNLRSVEKDLDTYFRDTTKVQGLPDAVRSLTQVAGAMTLLGHQDAATAAKVAADRVTVFTDASEPPPRTEFERVAASLGALGFFVEGLLQPERQNSSFEFDRESGEFRAKAVNLAKPAAAGGPTNAIEPATEFTIDSLDRLTSKPATPAEPAQTPSINRSAPDSSKETPAAKGLVDAGTVDAGLVMAAAGATAAISEPEFTDDATVSLAFATKANAQRTESLMASLADAPQDQAVRGQLREALEQVRDDAMLHDDGELKKKAAAAIDLLENNDQGSFERLSASVSSLAVDEAPAAIAAAVLPDSDDEVDSELLEIFLAEADEVLVAIHDSLASLQQAPSDQEFLTTIRRGFHTLKGSSRMVGLNSFGEAGWAMEQVMNVWLSEDRPGNSDLFGLVAWSCGYFSAWTKALGANPRCLVQPAVVVAASEQFRAGQKPAMPAYGTVPSSTADAPGEEIQAAEVADTFNLTQFDDSFGGSAAVSAISSSDRSVIELPLASLDEPLMFAAPQPADEITLRPVVDEVDLEPLAPESMPDLAIDLSDFSASIDQAIAGMDPPQVRPVVEPAITAMAAPVAERLEPAVDLSEFVLIGKRQISRPLYMIFLGEADDLVAKLVSDSALWQAQKTRQIEEPVVRAAHSLKGSSCLVGLDDVHQIAKRLEGIYLRLNARPYQLNDTQTSAIVTAVAQLQQMLHKFAGGGEPSCDPQLIVALGEVESTLLPAPERRDELGGLAMSEEDLAQEAELQALEAEMAEQAQAETLVAANLEPAIELLAVPSEFASPVERQAEAQVGLSAEALEVRDSSTFDAADDNDASKYLAPRDAEATPAIVDELDADLLPIFVEEAEDYLPQIGEDLRRWAEHPSNLEPAHNLMRAMHTVKGSARMAGAMNLGQHVHEMETRIESLLVLQPVPLELIEALNSDHDRTVALFEQVKDPSKVIKAAAIPAKPASVTPVSVTPASVTPASVTPASVAPASVTPGSAKSAAASPALAQTTIAKPGAAQSAVALAAMPATSRAAANVGATAHGGAAPVQLVRVRADLLDRLVNDAGEVSIARSRLDNELSGMRQSLGDLTENVNRLRTQLREIEIQAESQIQASSGQQREQDRSFDPLEFDRFTRFQELARMLAEAVNDVATVQQNASKNLDTASQDLLRQGQVLRELQQNLMRVRMVQIGSISDRMYRVVRQAAKDADKRVNLDLHGSASEIDRGVLEKMAGPIEHLLRNAVAHGIESRAERLASGKSETGEIRVEVRQEGNEIVLSFADDGKGLDVERIKARAVKQGLVAANATLSVREAADLIFSAGFSTAEKITELSGRGVGMDVVRSETIALGGRIDTESTPGQGTRFIVHLPLTLAIAQVVMVTAGEQRFAIPSSSVEHVMQLKSNALTAAYAARGVDWQGSKLPIAYLSTLIEASEQKPVVQHYSPIIIVRSGLQRLALHVDAISRNQEVVVKNVGPQIAQVRGVAGATVMGNGDIILIINPVVMAQAAGDVFENSERAIKPLQAEIEKLPATIMVVDDSVTVRKVTQRLLGRERYDVLLAKDGIDALRQLQDSLPDVMLVDIEMPRMDGFDLTRHIRADERFKHIPIIMITSRTADKHRNYAKSLGVNVYLGKPFVEEELLGHIRSFVDVSRNEAMTA